MLKITEDVNGRRDTIMIPDEALDDFADALERILDADGAAAAPGSPDDDR